MQSFWLFFLIMKMLSPSKAVVCSHPSELECALNTHTDCARSGCHNTMVTVLHHRSIMTGWSRSRWLRLLIGTCCGHPLNEQHTCGLETAFTGQEFPELNRASGDGASWTCPSKRMSSGSVLVPERMGWTFYFKNKYLQIKLSNFFFLNEWNLNMLSPAFPKSYIYTTRQMSHIVFLFVLIHEWIQKVKSKNFNRFFFLQKY